MNYPNGPGLSAGATAAQDTAANETSSGKITLIDVSCYVPHYTTNIPQATPLSKHNMLRA